MHCRGGGFWRRAAVGARSPASVTEHRGCRASRCVCDPRRQAHRVLLGEAADGLCVLRGFVLWIWFVKMILAIQKTSSLSHKVSFISSSEGIQNLIWDYRDKVRFGSLSRNSICRCQKMLMGQNCFRLKLIIGNCV